MVSDCTHLVVLGKDLDAVLYLRQVARGADLTDSLEYGTPGCRAPLLGLGGQSSVVFAPRVQERLRLAVAPTRAHRCASRVRRRKLAREK